MNKILKQHMEMHRMMKQLQKLGKKGLLRHGLLMRRRRAGARFTSAEAA